MDLFSWGEIAAFVSAIFGIGGAIYAWLTRDAGKALSAIDRTNSLVADHDRRIQLLESEMRHLPAKEDLDGLKEKIAELSLQVAVSNEAMKSVQRTVSRVDEYLTRAGK